MPSWAHHYADVIMNPITSQITSLTIVYSTADHDCLFKRRSKKTSKLCVTGLCAGIHRGLVNSPHKCPVTRNIFPFDDVLMMWLWNIRKMLSAIYLINAMNTVAMCIYLTRQRFHWCKRMAFYMMGCNIIDCVSSPISTKKQAKNVLLRLDGISTPQQEVVNPLLFIPGIRHHS